ncbi:hypothetical protein [Neobacillus cucumis]|uniref:Uncharacterized protein n=1 Tax=Neobacillus cucumis TaxID=1740721 RepID=A0A2N5HR27_9BACI|nr:hypothetical protein [Neobacillus cucumis]PLS07986.1 hypothetical protein CVD27_04735 [Neobacillus cucumis]
MKFSKQSLDTILGVHRIARHKKREKHILEENFENPIIHKEIQGDRVFVPLNIERVWNEA